MIGKDTVELTKDLVREISKQSKNKSKWNLRTTSKTCNVKYILFRLMSFDELKIMWSI